jgi:signal transduction histidine kinase
LVKLFEKLRRRRTELRMALIFLGLILLPSGLLAYLSWRALESEKALSRERLQESYRQFAELAARGFDEELRGLERQWSATIRDLIKSDARERIAPTLAKDSLMATVFSLAAPGRVAASVRAHEEAYLLEHRSFRDLVETGDELEYNAGDLSGALAAYRKILERVSQPQLRGMAESFIGRVQQKRGEWEAALATFRHVLEAYAEVRDLDNMYLRFLAQFQIASCEENLGRDREALETLLRLQEELWERSDAISAQQYSYFHEQIQLLARRLVVAPQLESAAAYQEKFQAWAGRDKKRVGRQYFAQLLEGDLNKFVLERGRYRARFRYISDAAAEEPFLLAYHYLPDVSGSFVNGLIGFEIDLAQLRQRLLPNLTRNLRGSERVSVALVNERSEAVLGAARTTSDLIATQTLAPPFDFWQVAVYLNAPARWERRWDFRATLGLWLIALLLLSILLGAFWFIRRAAHEAFLSRMKSNFVSNVSHEFRTPLASIKMLAELLEMQLAAPAKLDPGKAQQYLGVIRRESDRLTRLIENVLDFAKIERGVKQYRFEYEEPSAVLLAAVEAFRPHAEAQGFHLDAGIAPDLPEMRLDADAVTQALLNLLSNAVKYSEDIKEIRVRAYCDEARLFIEVADRGLGIAPEELPKIFDDFYRVDARLSTNQQGGMGLGLTLARHIARAHGGDIAVQSTLGQGSIFTMSLPLHA